MNVIKKGEIFCYFIIIGHAWKCNWLLTQGKIWDLDLCDWLGYFGLFVLDRWGMIVENCDLMYAKQAKNEKELLDFSWYDIRKFLKNLECLNEPPAILQSSKTLKIPSKKISHWSLLARFHNLLIFLHRQFQSITKHCSFSLLLYILHVL